MTVNDIVRDVLEGYPSVSRTSVIEPLGMAGGLSGALFWRIDSPSGPLVLRRWPPEHPSRERLEWIHTLQFRAKHRGCMFVPAPLATTVGSTFVEQSEHLWELSPWMSGVADFHRAPTVEKLRAAMCALAQFHVAVADFPAMLNDTASHRVPDDLGHVAPAIRRRISRLCEPHPGGAAALGRAVRDSPWPELALLAREFVTALPTACIAALSLLEPVSRMTITHQPCLRDIWHDHVLFTGDRVTGLVDFGAADIDTPAGDIARLLGSLVGDDRECWAIGIEAYSSARPLSTVERAAIPALDAAATVIALTNWVRWIYVEGREFNNRTQVVTRFDALMKRFRTLGG